jgi:hypothetical protein
VIRTCDGTNGCDCGLTFDDAGYDPAYPHLPLFPDVLSGEERADWMAFLGVSTSA